VDALGAIEVEIRSERTAIVSLAGEHDLDSKVRVAQSLTAACACPDVLVDLSECTFVDSSIVACIMHAAGRQQAAGGTLELVASSAAHCVRRALEIMGIDTVLTLHSDRNAGIVAISGPRSARPQATSRAIDGERLPRSA
jgi:anti-anti-sigma factor